MYRTLIGLFLSVSLLSSCTPTGSQHLKRAEELSRQGEIDQAITEYRAHMRERASIEGRPEWENPAFYLILIGDLELRRGKPDEALARYFEADEAKVDAPLISDRIRSVAAWYEQQNRLPESIALLQAQRARDPLLFDPTLDRLAKQLTALEEELAGKTAQR